MSTVRGNVASVAWGSTLAGLAHARATCVLELRADDGRGVFHVHFQDGAVVDARTNVPGAEAIQVAIACNLIAPDDVARVRGAVMAAPRGTDEIDAIAAARSLTTEEAQYLRRRTVAHRAALTFGVAYGNYASTEGVPPGPHVQLGVDAIIYLGALTFMPAQRLRDELGRFGDLFQVVDSAGVAERFGLAEAEAYVVQSLASPHTQESLASMNRHLGQRELLAVLYALVTTGVAKGSRRTALATGTRSPIAGAGVTFKPRTTTPPATTPVAPPSPPQPPPAPLTTTPQSTPPSQRAPTAPPAAPAAPDEGNFDLGAALLDELGDAPLAFEAPLAPVSPSAVSTAAAGTPEAPRSRTIRRTGQLLAFISDPTRKPE